MFGVARLPNGRRKQQHAQAVSAMVDEDFAGSVLAFDVASAVTYAALVADRERTDQPIATADTQIAAIYLTNSAALPTRNHRHFERLGLTLINPWG